MSNAVVFTAEGRKLDFSPMRYAVLEMIQTFSDGLTCDEVEVLSGWKHQSCSARLNDLYKAGAIVDSGTKRPTRSGVLAIIWVLAPQNDDQEVISPNVSSEAKKEDGTYDTLEVDMS